MDNDTKERVERLASELSICLSDLAEWMGEGEFELEAVLSGLVGYDLDSLPFCLVGD
jgi:hypothetical protein